MKHKLNALNVRDIAKNAINAAVAAATYKYTKEQLVERTEHEPDDLIVRVGATAAGSSASLAARPGIDNTIDKIADWINVRRGKPTPIIAEVPTES